MKTTSILLLLLIVSRFSNGQSPIKLPPCTTPTITITGNTHFCQGGHVTLCASGGTNYLWSGGDTTSCISAAPPTSITLTLQVSNPPCFKDTTIAIIVDTMPNVRITGSLLCNGDSTIIHVFGGYTYLWNTGATTDSILGILDSTYYVNISKGACSRDSVKITVTKWCTGIPTISNQLDAQIFPNPCSNNLNIAFENLPDLSSIQITDITGRMLLTAPCQLNTDHYSIDVSALSNGMYFLHLNSSFGIEVKKFIKE
jgi:hypothetical protein